MGQAATEALPDPVVVHVGRDRDGADSFLQLGAVEEVAEQRVRQRNGPRVLVELETAERQLAVLLGQEFGEAAVHSHVDVRVRPHPHERLPVHPVDRPNPHGGAARAHYEVAVGVGLNRAEKLPKISLERSSKNLERL